jgi:hypothetical protein
MKYKLRVILIDTSKFIRKIYKIRLHYTLPNYDKVEALEIEN